MNKKVIKNKIKKNNFIKVDKGNIDFLKFICSKSSIDFHELYYVNANKYVTCLQLFEMMDSSQMGFFNDVVDLSNVLVTCDVSHVDPIDYSDKFDGIITKYENQKNDTKKLSKFKKAKQRQNEVIDFDNEREYTKDEVKTMTIRIYVFDISVEKLQERVDKLVNKLSSKGGCRGYIQVNDLLSDYKALTMIDNPNKKMVASSTIADYLIKSEVNRVDEHMGLVGYTTNGNYAPDLYNFENSSYNLIVFGGMGSGKSALLKTFIECRLNYNDHIVYIFDIHKEYDEYCNENEIETISIDENESVNIMQIFSVNNDCADDIIRENDVQTQISMVVARFVSMNDFERQSCIIQLELHMQDVFKKYVGTSLSLYKDGDWCILGDVLDLINERTKADRYTAEEKKDIYFLSLGLKKMCGNYGYLFNRHTTMNFDLNTSLRFDFSFLQNNDDMYLKASYVSLLMSYVRKGIFMNGVYNMRRAKEENKQLHDLKRPYRTLEVLVDETAQYNEKAFLQTANSCKKLARKCMSGFTYIFHGIKDIQKTSNDCADELKEMFELCTNKIIGKCDGETINELPKYVSGVTKRDMQNISRFEKGPQGERTFFAIDDKQRKTVFTSIVTKEQKKYFKGGV